jgi:prevent-host-death family protein
MSHISLTTLRQQLFKVVDRIIKTGVPVEISRRGHKLRIVRVVKTSKLARLTPHNAIVGNPEDLVAFKAGKWRKGKNL